MKSKFLCLIVLLSNLLPLNNAFAKSGNYNWLLGVDLSYLSIKSEAAANGETVSSERGNTLYDLSLVYFVASAYIGAIYTTTNTTNTALTLSANTSGNALGASAGYAFDNGTYITISYLITATNQDYKKGSGSQIDLGWRAFLSSAFFIGTKLTLRTIRYAENNTISGFDTHSDKTILPYLSFGFSF